jgi:acetyl-CoA C-acetyltransferase
MEEVYIVGAARTAIGTFGGALANTPAAKLGGIVIKETMKRGNIPAGRVDEVVMGCVLTSGLGQNVARQAAVNAGIGHSVNAWTLGMVCGSGMKAVHEAALSIAAGYNKIVVAGGMENMSLAPYTAPGMRWGQRMNRGVLEDSMIKDGLWCAFNDYHMGVTAENIAEKYKITRDDQDEFALSSQNKAQSAIEAGKFKEEIIPLTVSQKKESFIFETDEYPRKGTTKEKLSKLSPAFKKEGTVTAGNSSGINDGAAALVLASGSAVKEMKLEPLARITSFAQAGVDPAYMGIGPVEATGKALEKAGLSIGSVDLVEANEAFAAQSIAVARELKFDEARVNVNGGAIALGHPIGASGARILVTLVYEMHRRKANRGLATLCVGGGMGLATLIERL